MIAIVIVFVFVRVFVRVRVRDLYDRAGVVLAAPPLRDLEGAGLRLRRGHVILSLQCAATAMEPPPGC